MLLLQQFFAWGGSGWGKGYLHRLEGEGRLSAGEIGLVQVDHGQTSCQTLFAAEDIRKTWGYKEEKAGNR